MAGHTVMKRGASIALACRAFSISLTFYGYSLKLTDENAQIADWLERLTTMHKTWGFGLCFFYLPSVQGFCWNHKRVYRI
jgi:putative transposase